MNTGVKVRPSSAPGNQGQEWMQVLRETGSCTHGWAGRGFKPASAAPSNASLKAQVGHNKVNSSLCVRSKSAPVTHSTNNGQVQMNRRAVCFVKKTPKYHLHRRHNIKYWYEEPTIGMGKKPQTMGTYGTFLGICDPLRK
ncbi:uncharacterized protein LOC144597277 isoform X1 [Rhinoraja longicauda]